MQIQAVEHTHFTLVEKNFNSNCVIDFQTISRDRKKQTTKQPTKATNVSFTVRIMLDLT